MTDASAKAKPVSPSQIGTFQLCQRKWAWDKIDGIPQPESPGTEMGKSVHKHQETWFTFRKPPMGTERSHVVARKLLEKWPHPSELRGLLARNMPDVEPHISATRPGYILHGYMDLGYWHPTQHGVYVVGDHKSTSSLNWAKTKEDLLEDPQGLGYPSCIFEALDEDQSFPGEHDDVRIMTRWVYVTTAQKPQTRVVENLVTRQEVEERMQEFVDPTGRLIVLARSHDRALDLEPNLEACDRFGGCPYRENCKISGKERLRSLMATQSLKEQMEERVRKQREAAAGGKGEEKSETKTKDPINPPEKAKATKPSGKPEEGPKQLPSGDKPSEKPKATESPREGQVGAGSRATEVTLRDHFAGQALQGMIARGMGSNETQMANSAFCFADAMIKARGQ